MSFISHTHIFNFTKDILIATSKWSTRTAAAGARPLPCRGVEVVACDGGRATGAWPVATRASEQRGIRDAIVNRC